MFLYELWQQQPARAAAARGAWKPPRLFCRKTPGKFSKIVRLEMLVPPPLHRPLIFGPLYGGRGSPAAVLACAISTPSLHHLHQILHHFRKPKTTQDETRQIQKAFIYGLSSTKTALDNHDKIAKNLLPSKVNNFENMYWNFPKIKENQKYRPAASSRRYFHFSYEIMMSASYMS
ncbi:MAG: hypothetical protein LUC90_03435 [Lachnospiraceae bacterium]|nr:hypothetical protein [Lachnospiraceae bacterium]